MIYAVRPVHRTPLQYKYQNRPQFPHFYHNNPAIFDKIRNIPRNLWHFTSQLFPRYFRNVSASFWRDRLLSKLTPSCWRIYNNFFNQHSVFPRLIDPVFCFLKRVGPPVSYLGMVHYLSTVHYIFIGTSLETSILWRVKNPPFPAMYRWKYSGPCSNNEKALATTKIVVAQPKIAFFFDPPHAFLVRMRNAMNSFKRPGLLFGHGLLFFREASRRVYYLSMVYYSSMVH